jgi:hypothetical protein
MLMTSPAWTVRMSKADQEAALCLICSSNHPGLGRLAPAQRYLALYMPIAVKDADPAGLACDPPRLLRPPDYPDLPGFSSSTEKLIAAVRLKA